MRLLFSTGSAAAYMQPPQLGDDQINCGPDWQDVQAPDGRWLSLGTPVGEYDLADVVAKLPPDQKPDVVVCLVDASWRNVPHNLSGFSCPRVLLVADTHHLSSPLVGMLRYTAGERFDRIVLLYDRHHAALFHAAGFRNLHWFPGLTFPHGDQAVRAARRTGARKSAVAFVGQAANLHPWRRRMLDALVAANLPIQQKPLSQAEALRCYGAALLGFNASLNGDLNLRVFEILSSGAALLTDRLAPASGLTQILGDGREMLSYGSAGELVERAKHALDHPSESAKIGSAGARWFYEHLGESRRRTAFQTLAIDGTPVPEFDFSAAEKTRVFFGGNTNQLVQSLLVYEGVQDLHRDLEKVRITLADPASPDVAAIFTTLPRIELFRGTGTPAEMAVLGRDQALAGPKVNAPLIWCWDAQKFDFDGLADAFNPAGFSLMSRDVAVLRIEEKGQARPATSTADQLAEARRLVEQGAYPAAFTLAQRVLESDNQSVDAWVLLGELLLATNACNAAEGILRQALQRWPGDARMQVLLADACRRQGKMQEAEGLISSVLERERATPGAWLVLAGMRLAEGKSDEADTALKQGARLNPATPAEARALGDLLKRRGKLFEALRWHHRAVGGDGEISLSATSERRRVVFVVQHGPLWPSTASVYQAFAEDSKWQTTVVALPYRHPYYTRAEEQNAIFEFLRNAGIPYVSWDQFPLSAGCADVIFLQNPYDVTRPEGCRTMELMRLVPRVAYIPYGLEIGGGEENASMQANLATQQLAWAVFARSKRHRAAFEQHCATGAAHVHVTGHPKMDALRQLPTVRDAKIDCFVANRKMVFWNPQFDVRPDGSAFGKGYSTFLRWQHYLPDELARRPGLAFVIRPHPLFFATLEQRHILTTEQIQEFLNRCAATGAFIDRSPSYLPVFAASAAMISDPSSFLLEYAGTGRPVLYLHNPGGPGLNSDGEFVTNYCYSAQSEDEIRRFLDLVEAGQDPRGPERRAATGAD